MYSLKSWQYQRPISALVNTWNDMQVNGYSEEQNLSAAQEECKFFTAVYLQFNLSFLFHVLLNDTQWGQAMSN